MMIITMNKVKNYNQELLRVRKRSLASFSNIEHRLESLGVVDGVEWINDSKATDLESTHYALSLFKQPIIWIVESSILERDYSVFENLVRYNVKTIICINEPEANIKNTLGGVVLNYSHEISLESAVCLAKEISQENEVVLFSPACPTNSDYESYKDRGEKFKLYVNEIK